MFKNSKENTNLKMKFKRCLLLKALTINYLIDMPMYAMDSLQVKVIQVFEIRSEIDPRMTRHVKLGFEEAKKNNADLVIIDLNTYGGMLDDADKIRTMILNFPKPVYVFVNNNAASAGALISIACDSIYMSPGANIGAATVVNGADGQPLPDKYQSYMRSMMRSTAEANKRNPKIAEAMVDPSIEIPGIIAKDKVLTFTTSEAIKNGFCEGEFESIDDLIQKKGFSKANLFYYKPSLTERIIAFFLNPFISSLLILAIIAGIYFEMQTPGVGFPSLVALLAAVLYLIPYYLNGLAQYWEIFLLLIGIFLLAAEIFFVPGFGIVGFLGGILVLLALILVMLNNNWFDFTFVPEKNIVSAIGATSVGLFGFLVIFLFFGAKIVESKSLKKIVLTTSLLEESDLEHANNVDKLIGSLAETVTPLRPVGKVQIHGVVYHAQSDGDFIEKGQKVKVIDVNGNILVVSSRL